MDTIVTEPLAWLMLAALLAASWPVSQHFRHDRLQPFAAYLLFVSTTALVSGVVFWGLAWVIVTTGPGAATGAAVVLGLLVVAVAAGLLAGRWILRFPQWRRTPR
ncbi:hypothetical protein P6F26_14230 [Roseibacterium sp. SDUM158017]|uniref:hypothetical protein n=1 Tax=Roseicyclus salinarum TaxID=3036773 RepID=UPI00241588CC|nr:hypothetical protein [Roseibacterium sp. SDUM158017]MDG4649598.1 hypothetical protein [Roseibacterium sp. SDUM158017]